MKNSYYFQILSILRLFGIRGLNNPFTLNNLATVTIYFA